MIEKKKGFALVTTLVVSAIVLVITSTFLYKISQTTRELIRSELIDKSANITDAAISITLDKITALSMGNGTYSGNDSAGSKDMLSLIDDLHSTDWVGTSNTNGGEMIFSVPSGLNIPTQKKLAVDNSFLLKIKNDKYHSAKFMNLFFLDPSSSFQTASNIPLDPLNPTINTIAQNLSITPETLNTLHDNSYSFFRIKSKSGKNVRADVKVSVLPLSTNISDKLDSALHSNLTEHYDLLKLRVTSYMPSYNSPQTSQVSDLIIKRPIVTGESQSYDFSHAILSDGTVDIGNKDTTSGPTSTTIDTEQAGDIHSNGNVVFGSQGKVNGKATANGIVKLKGTDPTGFVSSDDYDPACNCGDIRDTTTKVTNKSDTKSSVAELPIPEIDQSNLPEASCNTSGNPIILENCKLDGDLNVSGQTKVEMRGSVHITGNIKQTGGNASIIASGSTPVKVIADGTIQIGGGSSLTNTQEVAYVSNSSADEAIKISGNPGTGSENGAVFFTTNENAGVKLAGNIGFFGAVISKGLVTAVGNSGGIKRDSDLSALSALLTPAPPDRKKFLPQIVTWKTLNKKGI